MKGGPVFGARKKRGMTESVYLNTREAAAHLGLSACRLDRYRASDDGPVFLSFGGRVGVGCGGLDVAVSEQPLAPGRCRPCRRRDRPGPRSRGGGGGAVPIDHVALDLERRHGAVGECLLVYCHRAVSLRRLGAARNDLGADAVTGAGGGRLFGVAHQMGVLGGRADPDMAEQPADRRQSLAEGQGTRRIRMPKIVQLNISQTRKRCCVTTEYPQQRYPRSAPQPRG